MSRVCVLVSRCGDCDWSQFETSVLQRWEYPYTRVVEELSFFFCGATQGECDGNVNCDTCQRSGCRRSKEERRGMGDWTELEDSLMLDYLRSLVLILAESP